MSSISSPTTILGLKPHAERYSRVPNGNAKGRLFILSMVGYSLPTMEVGRNDR